MKIYPSSTRIPVKIGDVTFQIAPLTRAARLELASHITQSGGNRVIDNLAYSYTCVKHCVKGVEGLKYHDGKDFRLRFDDAGLMTEESLDELLQIEKSHLLTAAVGALANEIKEYKIDGVQIDLSGVSGEESKKKK